MLQETSDTTAEAEITSMVEMGVIHKTDYTTEITAPHKRLNTALQHTTNSEPQHCTAQVSATLMGEHVIQI